MIMLEVPPYTFRPKRWRKRPRRCYTVTWELAFDEVKELVNKTGVIHIIRRGAAREFFFPQPKLTTYEPSKVTPKFGKELGRVRPE